MVLHPGKHIAIQHVLAHHIADSQQRRVDKIDETGGSMQLHIAEGSLADWAQSPLRAQDGGKGQRT